MLMQFLFYFNIDWGKIKFSFFSSLYQINWLLIRDPLILHKIFSSLSSFESTVSSLAFEIKQSLFKHLQDG